MHKRCSTDVFGLNGQEKDKQHQPGWGESRMRQDMKGEKEPTGKEWKNSKYKGPGAGMSLASWRRHKEVSVTAAA